MRTRTRTILAGLVLAAALVGGVAWATIPSDNGAIQGCYTNGNGNLRVVESADECRNSETAISWNHQGQTGATGANGKDGAAGAQGPAGAAGADGTNGADGLDGTDGLDGVDGVDGSDGAQGLAGAAGADGTNGTNGLDGTDGATGDKGDTGNTGPAGAAGATGATGATGQTGPVGTALAYAHVNADGTIDPTGTSGNVTVSKSSPNGGYCIGVTGGTVHAAVVSLDSRPLVGGTVQAGVFSATGCPSNANDILVITRPQTQDGGTPGADRAFYIIVN